MNLAQIKQELTDLKTLLTNFVSGKTSNSAAAPDITALQGKIISFETVVNSQLSDKDKTIVDHEKTITDLRSQLKTAEDKTQTLETENATLKTNVESEKKRANETLASLGIDTSHLPSAEASKGGEANNQETAWAKYHRLQASNPREAGQFWAQNADKILASKPKS